MSKSFKRIVVFSLIILSFGYFYPVNKNTSTIKSPQQSKDASKTNLKVSLTEENLDSTRSDENVEVPQEFSEAPVIYETADTSGKAWISFTPNEENSTEGLLRFSIFHEGKEHSGETTIHSQGESDFLFGRFRFSLYFSSDTNSILVEYSISGEESEINNSISLFKNGYIPELEPTEELAFNFESDSYERSTIDEHFQRRSEEYERLFELNEQEL